MLAAGDAALLALDGLPGALPRLASTGRGLLAHRLTSSSMCAKVLPGVVLGDFTVVAAGAVVTKSFPEGYSVLAGVPAKKIRDLDAGSCVRFRVNHAFHGQRMSQLTK